MSFVFKSIAVICIVSAVFFSKVDSLKIAVVPMPVNSHMVSMKGVSEVLIKGGHQVAIVVPEYNLPMFGDIPAITYQTPEKFTDGKKESTLLSTARIMYTIEDMFCRSTLQNRTVIQLLKSYDMMVTDSMYLCSFMLSQAANKRNIMIGIQGTLLSPIPYPAYPSHPAYIPQVGTTFNSKMNFFERVINTIVACMKEIILFNLMNYLAYTIKHEYNIRPDLGYYELMQTQDVTLIAGDFAVDYARPIPPNMVLIGPLSSFPAAPLPENLESFMQSSGDNGVVLVSMGTIFEFPKSKVPALLSSFKRVKQKILWKTKLNVENAPDNVKIVRWMPQNDILGHKKLKAFIAHGGSKGVYEASYHGVPVIGIPMQAEQRLNIAKAKAAGMALSLDKNNLTPDIIVDAITEIITNPRYKGNATRISRIMQSRPTPSREALVQWVEYIANNDVSHLKPVELNMPWYQYYLIDVMAFIACCIYCIYKICKCLLSWCCRNNKIKAE